MELTAAVEVVGAAVIGGVLTLAGLVLELIAAQQISAGTVLEGAWLVALGAVVTMAGITLLRGRAVGAIRDG
ncbi:MAG: hypothetical protein ACLFMX_06940 [Halobacteriales archaeon]